MIDQQSLEMIREAHEARLLKQMLAEKLLAYGGIKHEELKVICAMFGITEKEWVPNENI